MPLLPRRRSIYLIELNDPLGRTEAMDSLKYLPFSLDLIPVVTSDLPYQIVAIFKASPATGEILKVKEKIRSTKGVRNVDVLMELTEEEVQ